MRRDRRQLRDHLQRMAAQQIAARKMDEELKKTEELLSARRTPVFPSFLDEIVTYEYDGVRLRVVAHRLLKD